ncbi:hypothetical protein D6D21_03227 [Aureobasidium pullulans]|uniref:Apple domain-containing protein n=1 Tax=Aureobasidium pullulans TaxID=5580 RepID=A0AB74J3M0_AURPU|nr:hypothetical protein D6D21_03227 [Aureobasidium pullulans]
MLLFAVLLLASCTFAQSIISPPQNSSSNTCVKRSVLVYTSDSSTYFVTDIGTTSLVSSPTYCPNVSVSTLTSTVFGSTIVESAPTVTIYQPPSTVSGSDRTIVATQSASTITIYQQATSAQPSDGSQPTGNAMVSDNSFENGTSSPFNTSASVPSIWAEVVQSGPYQPRSGDSYLLITFNDTASPQRLRRQSTGPSGLLHYNVTQLFTASAGTAYRLSAWAAEVPNGNGDPQCSIVICGDGDCSSSFDLTSSYSEYSFIYQSPVDESSAVATFQLQCLQSGYVALDDVSVTSNNAAPSGNQIVSTTTATTTVFRTETVVQSQTFTQIETTTYISGSEVVLTTTVPTVIYMTATVNNPITETRTVSTLLLSTATATTAIPEYINVTVSSVSTTTTTLTTILNSTVISYQPSLVIQTEYATSTALFTTTQPGVPLPASTVYQDQSTAYVTLQPSTVVVTLEQPVITITPDPITRTSILDAQTSMVVSILNLTETVPLTLPQATAYITPSPVTEFITITLEPNTTTIYISVTPPPLTEKMNVSVTLPAETWTEVQSITLPQGTETIQITQTLPQITATFERTQTLPQITETLEITRNLNMTQYGPTITETLSLAATTASLNLTSGPVVNLISSSTASAVSSPAPSFVIKIVGGPLDGNYLHNRASSESPSLIYGASASSSNTSSAASSTSSYVVSSSTVASSSGTSFMSSSSTDTISSSTSSSESSSTDSSSSGISSLASSSTIGSTSISSVVSTTSSAPTLTTTFVIKIVGGPSDGNYLHQTADPYYGFMLGLTGTLSAATFFTIDSRSGFLTSDEVDGWATSDDNYSDPSPLIASTPLDTLPVQCEDAGGVLNCLSSNGVLDTLLNLDGTMYLSSEALAADYDPSSVVVRYEIVYQARGSIPTATTSRASRSPSPSATYSSNPLIMYNINCNVDYMGGDTEITSKGSLKICIDYCSSKPDCKALVYNGGTCYIKNKVSAPSGAGVDGKTGTPSYYSALRVNRSELTIPEDRPGYIRSPGQRQHSSTNSADHCEHITNVMQRLKRLLNLQRS